MKPSFDGYRRRRERSTFPTVSAAQHAARSAACLALAAVLCAFAPHLAAQQPQTKPGAAPATQATAARQKTFSSAEEASHALFAALESNDEHALAEILGPGSKDVISSGDPVEDNETRQQFVEKYQQMHRLVTEPDGMVTLYIGAENWPMPIPLVDRGGVWYFDTAAGKREILYRRVGRDEMAAIRTCQALVDAERSFYAQEKHYTDKFISDPGTHDGLYWQTAAGAPESPIGPLVAAAVAEGYTQNPELKTEPFHGYYFRMLKGRPAVAVRNATSSAPASAAAFAFLAYPAEYRVSGVMTFFVDQSGVVYQKDLGPRTAEIVKSMTHVTLDDSWQRSE
jgi:Protein of unknown function (DUF2950)